MGNYSRDTFNALKSYVGVRLQQGVPLVDADWNEREDIRSYELRTFLKWFVGDGVPRGNDGFRIIPTPGVGNDFVIRGGNGTAEGAGRCLVAGWEVANPQDLKYSAQVLYQNQSKADEWNKGKPPGEQITILPALTVTNAARTDLVYLDVWEREVNALEDSELVDDRIGVETCVRLKREWAVRVRENYGGTLPAAPAGHAFYPLAILTRNAGQIAAVEDKRQTVLTVASLSAEMADARGMKANLGNRLDESLTRGGQLRQHIVGMKQLDASVTTKLTDINRVHKVPLLQQTLFTRGIIVPVGGAYPAGIAFDGTHIWVGSYPMRKIDVNTNEAVATVNLGPSGPSGVAFDGTWIWVITPDKVSKINISSNTIAATVAVASGPYGIAFDGSHMWVTSFGGNKISKVNVATNAVAATLPANLPLGVAFDGSHVWVGNYGGRTISKIHVVTNAIVASIPVSSVSGLAFDGTHIWAANFDHQTVTKIDAGTNAIIATTTVGTSPREVAFDGTHVWVSSESSNTVSKIDPDTNAVVATIGVTSPYGMAFDGAALWVTMNVYGGTVRKILKPI